MGWKCKHCYGEFDFPRATDRANHTRHCKDNPQKQVTEKAASDATRKRFDLELGMYVNFEVVCDECGNTFTVREREKQFPRMKSYFCSRNCSNSVGGRAKVEKYGYKQYKTIAGKYYKLQCAVCGVEDILDVHHIDENRKNLHPSNLIFLCPNDHARLHRQNDERVRKVIEGHGAAWGGRLLCTENFSGVQIPDAPPSYFVTP